MKNKFYMIILVLFSNLLGLTSCGGPISETYSYNSAVVFSSSDIVNGKVEIFKGETSYYNIIKYFSSRNEVNRDTYLYKCHSINDREGTYFIIEENKSSDTG